MTDNVVPFKPKVNPESTELADMIRALQEAHDRGEIDSLMWAYTTKSNEVCTAMNGSMRVSTCTYLLAVLQERLMSWMSKS